MRSFEHHSPYALALLSAFSTYGCRKHPLPAVDIGSGREAAELFRAAVLRAERLVVSRRKQTRDALGWEEVKAIHDLPTIHEVRRHVGLKDKRRGEGLLYAGTAQYRLEFQTADRLVVLIAHYYQGVLSCALWDSDYKMTDEPRSFMKGFLVGAGASQYAPDYDGLPTM